ncbi:unnamed protein product [Arctia plantaginis]|uniref:Peptidase S1 domain-containing protein n=1 Tax=Arctia plantaginis TaxID=874455 RepID=A0A8S0ZPX6_ARCPL|nr:unnamed protein product [Arctia plantaginis]CAB3238092.1 unnamed protein product [Arctia plantaginis]
MALLTWAVLLLAGLTYTHAIGAPTLQEQSRSIAQIQFKLVSAWRQQCVGSIINNYYVVTTANCLQAPSNNRRLAVGNAITGTIHEVAIIYIHDRFSPSSRTANIGLVRAGTSWSINTPDIGTIPLVPQNYYVPLYHDLSVSGWGVTAQGGIIANQYLYTVVLQKKPITSCLDHHQGLVNAENICLGLVGRNGRDFDPSDTGAPVAYVLDGRSYLYGVLSFGSSARNNEIPIVAESIGAYSNWIRDTAV